jgi:ELWxxDGT repeat protein
LLFIGEQDSVHALWRFDPVTAAVTRVAGVDGPCWWPTPVPGGLVFVCGANDNRQLWKTDGTQAGTGVLKVINPTGSAFDDPRSDSAPPFNPFFRHGDTVFFRASDPVHGHYALWKTDGTASGTVLVTTSDGAWLREVTAFGMAGGVVFVGGYDGDHFVLWRTDGTTAGTYHVKDLQVARAWFAIRTLFLMAYDPQHGTELWKSDGTTAGTVLVKNISPDVASGMDTPDMVDLNGTLFITRTREHVAQLWRSDGTSQGTILVKEIPEGRDSLRLTVVNSRLIFGAGGAVWASDGTPEGTAPIRPEATAPFHTDAAAHAPHSVRIGSVLLLGGRSLWRTDGTAAGTMLLRADVWVVGDFGPVNRTVFFPAFSNDFDHELWKTDGTPDGTVLVKDIRATGSSSPRDLVNIGGRLFFSADDGQHGRELWTSDGTAAGTFMIRDINPGPEGSSPTSVTEVDGIGFFAADDGVNGQELWRTDGTTTSTRLWADVNPGGEGSYPSSFTAMGSALFFIARPAGAPRLWTAGRDGAAEVRVPQPFAPMGRLNSFIRLAVGIAAVDGKLWLAAGDDVHGTELWRSDGTADGTRLVQDIAPGPASSAPSHFVASGSNLFFTASTPAHGRELWVIDRPAPPAPGLGVLIITPPVNGTVYGPGIVCGIGGTRCEVVLPLGARVGLEPAPAAGFFFNGWTGACGSAMVPIMGTVICGASFSTTVPVPRTPAPAPAPIRLSLDRPSGVVQGTVMGNGWAFHCGSTIALYELLLDGAPVTGVTFTPGARRDDVPAIFGGECPSVGGQTGFTFNLDSSRLSGAVQNLQVRVTDDKGRTATTNGLPVWK